jgi:serine/threonine-protein kinase HipA
MDALNVKIWDKIVGLLTWDKRGFAYFKYEDSFIASKLELSPIHMPLIKNKIYSFPRLNRVTFKGLPGLLADSLSDNLSLDNPIIRLSLTGSNGMGALEFEYKDESILNENFKNIKNIKNKICIQEMMTLGTMTGGARPKATIAYHLQTGEIVTGQSAGMEDCEFWLIKFDGVSLSKFSLSEPRGYGKIEFAYYLMAKDSGINISESTLFIENGRSHFMTKRFDRENGKKIHMQSLCALTHLDYKERGSCSYETAFNFLRKLKLSQSDIEEFYRRMIFNIMAGNHDEHTKNISFLMRENGQWELSPAYDVTFSYDSHNKWLMHHQMSVNGKKDFIQKNDFQKIAKDQKIDNYEQIIEKIAKVVSYWPIYATYADVDLKKLILIRTYHEQCIFQ